MFKNGRVWGRLNRRTGVDSIIATMTCSSFLHHFVSCFGIDCVGFSSFPKESIWSFLPRVQSTRWQLHLGEQQELPRGNQSNPFWLLYYLHIISTCLPITNLTFCSGCCGLFALNDYRKKAGLSFSFLVFAALNITMVYNGANNLKKCPGEPMVPVYLLGISHFFLPPRLELFVPRFQFKCIDIKSRWLLHLPNMLLLLL